MVAESTFRWAPLKHPILSSSHFFVLLEVGSAVVNAKPSLQESWHLLSRIWKSFMWTTQLHTGKQSTITTLKGPRGQAKGQLGERDIFHHLFPTSILVWCQ